MPLKFITHEVLGNVKWDFLWFDTIMDLWLAWVSVSLVWWENPECYSTNSMAIWSQNIYRMESQWTVMTMR